ncbi:AAA family ATPase [Streptomyces sp. NPDC059866]|uniref:AAA family ATPase n=1 Tax=Streptomyces sp. NPDC059866 TaxID=3346978 RepID=UPI00365A756D
MSSASLPQVLLVTASGDDPVELPPEGSVREVLAGTDCLLLRPLAPDTADLPWHAVEVQVVARADVPDGTPVYLPPPAAPRPRHHSRTEPAFPRRLDDDTVVRLAYGRQIDDVATLLRAGLSVLVRADETVVPPLRRAMIERTGLRVVDAGPAAETADDPTRPLQDALASPTADGLLVIPDLALLASAGAATEEGDAALRPVRAATERPLLAFASSDRVLSARVVERFSRTVTLTGCPTHVHPAPTASPVPIGRALVTADESAHFSGFDPEDLHSHISGLNPLEVRDAIGFAVQRTPAGAGIHELYEAVRVFKTRTSPLFTVPDVSFEDIAGYDDVKEWMRHTVGLLTSAGRLPAELAHLRSKLVPRGLLLYGPPGNGKRTMATAVARALNATVSLASGPELLGRSTQESEARIRELFREARRNAPSVVVLDELESVTSRFTPRTATTDGPQPQQSLAGCILAETEDANSAMLAPVLVIGVTNRPDLIDEALLRPGRFHPVSVDLPNHESRLAMTRLYGRRYAIDVGGVDELIAAATEGLNGDDIHGVLRAAFVAAYLQDPPVPPTPEQLGSLVGRAQRARRERRLIY